MVFGESVDAMAAVGQGDKVYVEGTLSLNEWTAAGGEKKHGLPVSSWRSGPQRIGKYRAPRPKQPAQHGTHAPLPPDFKDPDGSRREMESERRYA
jgi:single-stranded DNA-binding protein